MNRSALVIVCTILILQVSISSNAQDLADSFDLSVLSVLCRTEQSVVDQCPDNWQYCNSTADCPQQQVCSCRTNCGNLACMLPSDIKVCGCHPLPRDGYSLLRSDSVEFFCNEGFSLSGVTKKRCVNGEWQPAQAFPFCQPVVCNPLPDLPNGQIIFSSPREQRFNTTASYTCGMGYSLVGDSSRVCQDGGDWSGRQPVCRRDGYWGAWSAWSDCDAECGSGLRSRSRSCVPPEEGARPCMGSITSELEVCRAKLACQASRLGCYSVSPWLDQPRAFEFGHPSLAGNVHRCLHHCKVAGKNYGVVRGADRCWCFNNYNPATARESCESSSGPLYHLYPAPRGECTKQRTIVEPYVQSYTVTFRQRYTTSCGFLYWGRCTRFRVGTRNDKRTVYRQKIVVVRC